MAEGKKPSLGSMLGKILTVEEEAGKPLSNEELADTIYERWLGHLDREFVDKKVAKIKRSKAYREWAEELYG